MLMIQYSVGANFVLSMSNQHLLMAAGPSCTVENLDAGKKLGSLHQPSADRTKQAAKTLINLCGVSKWSFRKPP